MKRSLRFGLVVLLLVAVGIGSWKGREAFLGPKETREATRQAPPAEPAALAGSAATTAGAGGPAAGTAPRGERRGETPALGATAPEPNPMKAAATVIASATACSLDGTVADPSGAPIAGATIRLLPREPAIGAIGATGATGATGAIASASRSDAAGRFVFIGLPPGSRLLTARAPRHLSAIDLEVEIPAATPLRITLETDRPARVRILDESRLPLQGAQVAARPQRDSGVIPGAASRGTSGPDGWVELVQLPAAGAAAIVLTVQAPGRPSIEIRRTVGDLRASPTEIVVPAGGRIAGVVVTDSGEAAAGARIVLEPSRPVPGEAIQPQWSIHASPHGRFEFAGVTSGEFILFADAGERGARRLAPVHPAPASDPDDLKVVLAATGTTEAREGRAPPPQRSVQSLRHGSRPGMGTVRGRLETLSPPANYAIGLAPEGQADDGARHVYRQSGRRPEFTLLNVPAGIYDVLFLVDGQVRSKVAGVRVEAGREAGPVELPSE